MGIFSSIFSGICSIASSIGSAISSCASAIGSAISGISKVAGNILGGIVTGISSLGRMAAGAIGGFFKGIATAAAGVLSNVVSVALCTLGPVLGPILGPIFVELAIKFVAGVISSLAEETQVVEPGEKPEEIGYRLEEADKHQDWKKRENFGSFKEYYAYLKEQIPEVEEQKVQANHLAYTTLGMEAELQAISEKADIYIDNNVILMAMRAKMQSPEVHAFIDAFKKQGFESLDVEDYFKGKLKGTEASQLRDALLDALNLYYPQKSRSELLNRLGEIGNAMIDDKQMVHNYDKELVENHGEQLEKDIQDGTLDATSKAYYQGAKARLNGEEA